ncbi:MULTISPECIES: sodium:proton antiporter [unclassified Pseudofrankia]|uniref:sodium:proton antiporter n=1 Tax=unclassified Pseudofrankia TaxID=2994372 RepID=UPI000AABCB39|nr:MULTISPECIES: NADH-quinone oxidoreductase subunit K [unclassified Pseudofrankia]MDT3445895.1 NADH-quinone oxidoreductase subunit K [Pseudofrankia sp. BMG5.37]
MTPAVAAMVASRAVAAVPDMVAAPARLAAVAAASAPPAVTAPPGHTVLNLTSVAVVSGLYAAGTFLLLQRGLLRVLVGIVLLGHATNLLLLLVGGKSGRPAMSGSVPPDEMSDPLPQAMALTSIVITFALTTFLLALAYRAWTLLGNTEVRDDVEDHRITALEERLEAQFAYHFPHLSLPRPHAPRHRQPHNDRRRPADPSGTGPDLGASDTPDPDSLDPDARGPGAHRPDAHGPDGPGGEPPGGEPG